MKTVKRKEEREETEAEVEKREAAERKVFQGRMLDEAEEEFKLMRAIDTAITVSDLPEESVIRVLNYVADRHLGTHLHLQEPERESFLETLIETAKDNLPAILAAVNGPTPAAVPPGFFDSVTKGPMSSGKGPTPVPMPPYQERQTPGQPNG